MAMLPLDVLHQEGFAVHPLRIPDVDNPKKRRKRHMLPTVRLLKKKHKEDSDESSDDDDNGGDDVVGLIGLMITEGSSKLVTQLVPSQVLKSWAQTANIVEAMHAAGLDEQKSKLIEGGAIKKLKSELYKPEEFELADMHAFVQPFTKRRVKARKKQVPFRESTAIFVNVLQAKGGAMKGGQHLSVMTKIVEDEPGNNNTTPGTVHNNNTTPGTVHNNATFVSPEDSKLPLTNIALLTKTLLTKLSSKQNCPSKLTTNRTIPTANEPH
jgi:hypothetical protein